MTGLICACGSEDLFAIKPGHDPIFEHPRDKFGLPDLRQKPVVTVQEVPCSWQCRRCLEAAFPKLNKMEPAYG